MALEKKPGSRINHGICSGEPLISRCIGTRHPSPARTVKIRCRSSKKRRMKLNDVLPMCGHPEIAHQFTGVAEAHARLFAYWVPGGQAQLTEDVAQRRNQGNSTPIPLLSPPAGCFFLWAFCPTPKSQPKVQDENSDIHQTNTGEPRYHSMLRAGRTAATIQASCPPC